MDNAKLNSKIVQSPHYAEIMKKYELFGRYLSARRFFNETVKEIDPNLTLRQWTYFIKKYNHKIQIKVETLMEKAANKRVTEVEMEESSARKILAIADLTLDEVVKNPELLSGIPIESRMKWLFQTMKSRDSRMLTLAKVNSEKRKDSMYDAMLKGAQYGAIDAEEVQDGQNIKKGQKKIDRPPESINFDIPEANQIKKDKMIEFNPDQI
ncbi:MAG TPA: hypothetical protein ENK36_04995 [Desulfobacterales bacterium]|nr:hypothetical protein [Desulfobacterales bacterium]